MISMVGKYVFNIFLPFFPATEYTVYGATSFLGIILLILIIYFSYLSKNWASFFFFIFPILFVVWKVPVVIIDTHLLWPIFAVSLLMGKMVIEYKVNTKGLIIFSLLFFLCVSPINFMISKAWSSDYELYKMTYNNERNCLSAREFSNILLDSHKISEFVTTTKDYLAMECNKRDGQSSMRILDAYLFFSSEYDFAKKVSMYSNSKLPNIHKDFYLAALYHKNRNFKLAIKYLDQYLQNPEFNIKSELFKIHFRLLPPLLYFKHYCLDREEEICSKIGY